MVRSPVTSIALLAAALTVLLSSTAPLFDYAYNPRLRPTPASNSSLAEPGRYKTELSTAQIDFPAHISDLFDRLWRFARLKRWHYTSVSAPEFFLGFAMVDVSYIAEAFVYVVPTATPSERFEFKTMLPLGVGTNMAPSSREGCTTFDGVLSGWSMSVRAQDDASATAAAARGARAKREIGVDAARASTFCVDFLSAAFAGLSDAPRLSQTRRVGASGSTSR